MMKVETDENKLRECNISEMLPAWKDIPNEFKNYIMSKNEWCQFITQWFFRGLPKTLIMQAKEEINCNAALSHISQILRAMNLSQEHKMAGCAYLLSEWFESSNFKDITK